MPTCKETPEQGGVLQQNLRPCSWVWQKKGAFVQEVQPDQSLTAKLFQISTDPKFCERIHHFRRMVPPTQSFKMSLEDFFFQLCEFSLNKKAFLNVLKSFC